MEMRARANWCYERAMRTNAALTVNTNINEALCNRYQRFLTAWAMFHSIIGGGNLIQGNIFLGGGLLIVPAACTLAHLYSLLQTADMRSDVIAKKQR